MFKLLVKAKKIKHTWKNENCNLKKTVNFSPEKNTQAI